MSDESLFPRLLELARRAFYRGEAVFSRFLDLNQQSEARRAAREAGADVIFDGGYPEAERRVAAFVAPGGDVDGPWPFSAVRISWRAQFGSPAHRDILGALMALGFEREVLGDIVMDEGQAYLFALRDMAEYISSSLTSCGRVSVKCERLDEAPPMPPSKGREKRLTVPSMRLDALVSAAYDLSRSEAARLIAQGRVFVDQRETLKTDFQVPPGALVSVRGQGRFRLERVEGETRRGREAVRVFVYGDK